MQNTFQTETEESDWLEACDGHVGISKFTSLFLFYLISTYMHKNLVFTLARGSHFF